MRRRGGRPRSPPSTATARSISYFTCTLSAARKNGTPQQNSSALTSSARGCTSPACSSVARRDRSLTAITSAATVTTAEPNVKHFAPRHANEMCPTIENGKRSD